MDRRFRFFFWLAVPVSKPSYLPGGLTGVAMVCDRVDRRWSCSSCLSTPLVCLRSGGGGDVALPPEEFNHWIGVGEIMRAEARERIEVHYEVFAKWMRDRQKVDPELVIREGEAVPQILAQVREDPEIGVLVLGAGTGKNGPGPLVTQMTRQSGDLPIPITIVPGDMSKERLEAIT